MTITGFEAHLRIHGAQSLKDKRAVVKSLIGRLQARFNVSAIESGSNDSWQLCRVGVALAALSQSRAQNQIEKIIEYLFSDDRIEVLDIIKQD